MERFLKRFLEWWLLVVMLVILYPQITCSEEYKYPVLRVPKMAKSPVIDGIISAEEWKSATAITGFANYGFPPLSLPNFLQPVWYLGYDDNFFYLAFKYPVYPKGSLHAKCKTKEQAESQFFLDSILTDDHTEIQICNVGRENAISSHFYKFMTNPWDMVSDQKVRYSIGQWGYEYETEPLVKSHFSEDMWEQEIAIPLGALEEKEIVDGKKWTVQLVSAQDYCANYYAWQPIDWLQFKSFPEIIFDSKSLAVQFLSLGEWMQGNPGLEFCLYNPTKDTHSLEISAEVISSSGEQLFEKKKTISLQPGESKKENIKAEGLKLGDRLTNKDNILKLDIYEPRTQKVYYKVSLPFIKFASQEVQGYIKNLAVGRKPAETKITFAYMPSYNLLKANTDVGILGIEKKIEENARYFKVSFGKEAGETIGINTARLGKDGTAELVFNFPSLSEGNYWIRMEILDEKGGVLISKKDKFERKIFPFENNRLGITDKIIPPYKPIKVENDRITFVSGEYQLLQNGMLSQVTNKLVPEGQEILAGEVKLILHSEGKKSELEGREFKWDTIKDTKVECFSKSELGPLNVMVNGQAEYDGQYLIEMDLISKGKVNIDKVELEIPLKNPIDTITVITIEGSNTVFNKMNPAKNAKEGIIWTNIKGKQVQPYIIYVGNGERGLYWYTDSYEGWNIDKYNPYIEIEKQKDRTILRVSFVNKPFVMDKPRKIRFAFLSVPVKPFAADARELQWDDSRSSVGAASWWGTIGCFVFPQKNEEWFYPFEGMPYEYKGKKVWGGLWVPTQKDGKYYLEKGKEYALYRAADYIGYLQPEFKVFSGEWVGTTNPPLKPHTPLLDHKDKDGNPIWPDPEQMSVYVKDSFTQSFYDFEIYYFYQMAKNTGIGGYWWDWSPLRKSSSLPGKTNLFMVRDFYKRLAMIDDELGIPNTNNVYAPGPVYQISWIIRLLSIENMYLGLESQFDDMFSLYGLDKYRAEIGKYSGLPVAIHMNIPMNMKEPRVRTVIGLSLLHDNGVVGVSKELKNMLREFGYFLPDTQWIPYWRSQKVVNTIDKSLLTTVYKRENKENIKLMLVTVNPENKDVKTDIFLQLENVKQAKIDIVDLESDDELSFNPVENGILIKNIFVKKHDYRLIGVTNYRGDKK